MDRGIELSKEESSNVRKVNEGAVAMMFLVHADCIPEGGVKKKSRKRPRFLVKMGTAKALRDVK